MYTIRRMYKMYRFAGFFFCAALLLLFPAFLSARETKKAPSREDLNWSLFDALDDSGFAKADELVKAGADVNFVLNDGESLLTAFCERGNVGAVKALLRYGADIEKKRYAGKDSCLLCCKSPKRKPL